MAVITIKLKTDFLFTGPQHIRLEFTDPKTGDTMVLRGEVRLEEVETSYEQEAFGGFVLRDRQIPSREYAVSYEGQYEIVEEYKGSLKGADFAAKERPRRAIDLRDITT